MLSNLINNSIDALEGKHGKIVIGLESTKNTIQITIKDNGKGMSEIVKNKILNNIAVTEGKTNGHGIGMTQVRETINRNEGKLSIDSELGKGTIITLDFPRIKPPHWICEEIRLNNSDIIVILDDDISIHGAWDKRFEPITKVLPNIQVQHFRVGIETLNFINALNNEEKQNVLLLTDFELLKQEIDGLEIARQTQIKRSILVTSYYFNKFICQKASKAGVSILPKQLASEVLIRVF
jgi:hypothetical protein